MNDRGDIGALIVTFAILSVMSVGGINATLPEIHRLAVDVYGWMNDTEFTNLFALAQAAPGPNLMVVTLIGWHVAGLLGATVATVAVILPSVALTFVVTKTWTRFREARWRKAIQAGMIPITVGLIAAAAYVIAVTVAAGEWRLFVITLITAAVVVTTKIHPLIPLAAAAGLGYAGLL